MTTSVVSSPDINDSKISSTLLAVLLGIEYEF